MKEARHILLLPLAMLIAAGGCTDSKNRKSEAAERHERWTASLSDSLTATEQSIDNAELRLKELHDNVGIMLGDFSHVSNPREVEGYTILSSWKGRYPLQSTGMIARITEGEGFEIVSALSGGVFSSVSVSAGGETVTSPVVPHDQALNYRRPGLTTVAFTGGKADSLGAFIAAHEPDRMKVEFLNPSRTGSWAMPEATAKMISATWRLYSSQKEAETLERQIPLLHRKVQILRSRIDRGQDAETDEDKD